MFELIKGYSEYVNKTFRLPVRLVERLEKLSAEYNLSVNKIVIQCIEYALNDMEGNNKITDWKPYFMLLIPQSLRNSSLQRHQIIDLSSRQYSSRGGRPTHDEDFLL